MSTRSFIARTTADGVEGVYCHWDGNPEHNGVILKQHYNDPSKLAELFSHGDMSTLGESVGCKHDFEDRGNGSTTYYGRDRGETGPHIKTKCYKRLDDLVAYAAESGCEFFYVFDRDKWYYAERGMQFFGFSDGSPFSQFKPL